MRALVVQPATFVWLVLMLATCVTWWSAKGGAVPPIEATVIVMVVAAVKARLVILHFMKLKGAPPSWRLLFEGWVVVSTTVILGGYWYALGAATHSSRASLPRVEPSRPVDAATYRSSTDSSKLLF
jgi:heme/copper-type cytochrome/quinol oxidase subunit 4